MNERDVKMQESMELCKDRDIRRLCLNYLAGEREMMYLMEKEN